ncbi:MAG: hypothetical protein IT302_10190 [Dehalococcoidia bacterium]|nr:hypothetical protein [Dehalococcoidia bacterium]
MTSPEPRALAICTTPRPRATRPVDLSTPRRWVVASLLTVVWPAGAAVFTAWLAARRLAAAGRTAMLAGLLATLAVLPFAVRAVPASAPVARAGMLAPFTLAGVAWGFANGGELHVRGSMLVMTNVRGGYGGMAGVTIGQVFLTPNPGVGNQLLMHETRHSTQWLVLGGLLPPLYAAADLAGGGAAGNVFELSAGLRDGGYPVS